MVLRLPLNTSKSPWWYSDYPYTSPSLPGGTQIILLLIIVTLVVLKLLYTHRCLPGGTQIIPTLITVSLVVLSLSIYTSTSPWWYSVYPYAYHSLPGGTQTIPIAITVSRVELRLSLYSSQSPYWLRLSLNTSQSPQCGTDYPFTHQSLPGGTHTFPIPITVSLVVLRLSLYSP